MAKSKKKASKPSKAAPKPAPKAKTTSKSAPKTKSTAKAAPKASAKATSAPKKTRKTRAPSVILAADERQKLLKPRGQYEETIEKVIRTWAAYRPLRVPGLSPARLGSLLKTVRRAEERERVVRELLESKLAPLADARRLAQHGAFKALLDTHAAVKLQARVDPSVIERFAFLADALSTNEGATPKDEAPKPPV